MSDRAEITKAIRITIWSERTISQIAEAIHDEVIVPLLAEAERRGAERGWDEGRENLVRWLQDNHPWVGAVYERGASGPNPYRAGDDQ